MAENLKESIVDQIKFFCSLVFAVDIWAACSGLTGYF